jgi:epoxyqueuosine reductase
MRNRVDEIVMNHLLPAENYIYGFADLTGLLDRKFEGYDRGISIGRILDKSIVDKVIDGPTMEYYYHYKKINEELEQLTIDISDDLNNNGIESLNIKPTVSTSQIDTEYSATLRTDISHKMVATRAGLGWIGKTDLFISKVCGPRLRLVSILLKTPLIPKSRPVDKSRCGNCNICVAICPAKAATGKLWDITVEREEFFDAWKCRKQCADFGRLKLGVDVRICGMCVAACPVVTKKTQNGRYKQVKKLY